MPKTEQLFARRQRRLRLSLRRKSGGRPRLSIFRSSKHIYAQVIDDAKGVTLAAASTLDEDIKGKIKTGADIGAAKEVGRLVAERAVKAGVKEVVFDRGGVIVHCPAKRLSRAAPQRGVEFCAQ